MRKTPAPAGRGSELIAEMGITVKIWKITDEDAKQCCDNPGRVDLLFHSATRYSMVHNGRAFGETLSEEANQSRDFVSIDGASDPTYIFHGPALREFVATNQALGETVYFRQYAYPVDLPALAREAVDEHAGLIFCRFEDW